MSQQQELPEPQKHYKTQTLLLLENCSARRVSNRHSSFEQHQMVVFGVDGHWRDLNSATKTLQTPDPIISLVLPGSID